MTAVEQTTQVPNAAAAWSIERLTPHFAGRVDGVDLRTVAAAGLGSQLRKDLARHKVLFVPGQQLDLDSQIELGRALGELTASHPVVAGIDERHPEIYALDSWDGGRSDIWHTDVTFMPRPPLGSILRAVKLPALGGSTNWVDLELAYDSLSPAVRRLADELVAEHDGNREFADYLQKRRGGQGNEWDGERVHLVRHRWREGDVVLWDNRSTAHYADYDYGDTQRIMHRITLRGAVALGPKRDALP